MPDISLGLTVHIGFSPDAMAAINRIAAALERIASPPSPAIISPPVQPVAPGGSAPASSFTPTTPAEGPSRAAGAPVTGRPEKPPGLSAKHWMTPERKQRLIELYPTDMTTAEIHAEIARMDGPPIGTTQHLRCVANNMKPPLHRPAHLVPSWLSKGRPGKAPQEVPQTAIAQAFASAKADSPPTPEPPAQRPAPAPVLSRKEVFQRISAIPPVTRSAEPPKADPIVAGQEAIRQWAAARGMQIGTFDLAAVNAKAASIGHPGFILKTRHA